MCPAGSTAKGAIVGLDVRTAGQSFMRGTAFFNPAEKFDDAMVEGLVKSAYALPQFARRARTR